MRSSHAAAAVDVAFDDPNLISDAGLVPVVALAEQIGLPQLVAEYVSITGAVNSAGANPAAKVMSLLAGMVAGADSIEDVDRLRLAGNGVVFDGIRAPSTPSSSPARRRQASTFIPPRPSAPPAAQSSETSASTPSSATTPTPSSS